MKKVLNNVLVKISKIYVHSQKNSILFLKISVFMIFLEDLLLEPPIKIIYNSDNKSSNIFLRGIIMSRKKMTIKKIEYG